MKGPDSERIKKLFDSIAGDYDRLNHLLSLGTDRRWRRRALASFVDATKAQEILDVACGTGDFSIDIASAPASPLASATSSTVSMYCKKSAACFGPAANW